VPNVPHEFNWLIPLVLPSFHDPLATPPKNPRPKLTRSVLGAKLTKLPYDP